MKKAIAISLLIMISLSLTAQKESFNKFIIRFVQDTVFQKERIVFPLTCVTWDLEVDDEHVFFVEKNKWKHDKLFYDEESDAYYIFYDNFDCEFRDTDEMVFRWYGLTDMDVKYFFKRINNLWYLIKLKNYDMQIP